MNGGRVVKDEYIPSMDRRKLHGALVFHVFVLARVSRLVVFRLPVAARHILELGDRMHARLRLLFQVGILGFQVGFLSFQVGFLGFQVGYLGFQVGKLIALPGSD